MTRAPWFEALPEGLRWATGGGNSIGGCNGLHIAQEAIRGTLCGLYGPETSRHPDEWVCGSCARIVKGRYGFIVPTRYDRNRTANSQTRPE